MSRRGYDQKEAARIDHEVTPKPCAKTESNQRNETTYDIKEEGDKEESPCTRLFE